MLVRMRGRDKQECHQQREVVEGARAQRSPTGGTKQRRGDEVTRRKVAQAARRSRCVSVCHSGRCESAGWLAGWLAALRVSLDASQTGHGISPPRQQGQAKAKAQQLVRAQLRPQAPRLRPSTRVSHSGGQPQPRIDRSRGIFLPCGRRDSRRISVLEFRGDGSSRVFWQRQAGGASIRAALSGSPAQYRAGWSAKLGNLDFSQQPSPVQRETGPMAASGMGGLKARSSSHHHELAGLGWAGARSRFFSMIGNHSRLLIHISFHPPPLPPSPHPIHRRRHVLPHWSHPHRRRQHLRPCCPPRPHRPCCPLPAG